MMDKISIIVPCYNVQDYLEECVESIIKQTYFNWELILVDDGSKDLSSQICDRYVQEDSRVRVIHKPNGGLVSARNAGYEVAKGDWIMYLDGDDWIELDTCEKIMQKIDEHNQPDIIFWKCIQELGNISIKGKWEWPCTDLYRTYVNDECRELAKNTLIYKSGIATAYCKLIKASYARDFNIFHNPHLKQGAEGLEFSLRAFYYARKALYVNEYFNHYRYNPQSISKKIDEKNTQYLVDCFNVMKNDIEAFVDRKTYMEPLYQRICYVLIAIALNTYFHKDNKDSLFLKCQKYSLVIRNNKILYDSIKYCNVSVFDKQRRITFYMIKYKLYFMLPIISWLKLYMLKRGKFNY